MMLSGDPLVAARNTPVLLTGETDFSFGPAVHPPARWPVDSLSSELFEPLGDILSPLGPLEELGDEPFEGNFAKSPGISGGAWRRTFRSKTLLTRLGPVGGLGDELFWGEFCCVITLGPMGELCRKLFGGNFCKVPWGQKGSLAANFSGLENC